LFTSRADLALSLSTVPQLAQPPTSLLSLPNDIFLLIYEEVYEERYNSITAVPLRIAEILVNKRIFSLARPLWFKHLSISSDQLDRRLAGLLKDKERRQALRSLDVPLNNIFSNLLESVILRLPQLTQLSLLIADDIEDGAMVLLSAAAATRTTLKELRLRSTRGMSQLYTMNKYYNDATAGLTTYYVALELNGNTYFIDAAGGPEGLSCMTSRWSRDLPFEITIIWPKTLSLDMQSGCGKLPHAGQLLRGLEAATRGGTVSSLYVLSLRVLTIKRADPSSRTTQARSSLISATRTTERIRLLQSKTLSKADRTSPTHESPTTPPSFTRLHSRNSIKCRDPVHEGSTPPRCL